MKEELKYNITSYLMADNKMSIVLSTIIILIMILIIIFSCIYNIYNVNSTNAITNCEKDNCFLSFYNYGIEYEKYQFVELKNKKYEVESIDFMSPNLDEKNTIFQEVNIKLKNYKGLNNEIVEIKIFKNKEKLIKKIFKIVLER